MRSLAFFFAVCLMPLNVPSAVARAASDGACVTSPAKIAGDPKLTIPENAKPTAKNIAFEVDIGSDGRVRGLQLDQSSGDAAFDLSARQALQAASYVPPQTGCVAYSGSLYLSYAIGPDNVGPAPQPVPVGTCTPFVGAFLQPGQRDRKHTGTAIVAVGLDAAATLASNPVLRKSTGSTALDAEAVRIASSAHYQFVRNSACTPQAFTYALELTFQ